MRYVVGFMFSANLEKVALIRKQKPEWQKGKLNGIGGKIEDGESAIAAMVREFSEETGRTTSEVAWKLFAAMHGGGRHPAGGFDVVLFASTGTLVGLRSNEAEEIEIHPVSAIRINRIDVVENLTWMIGLAYDFMNDGRPQYAVISYP